MQGIAPIQEEVEDQDQGRCTGEQPSLFPQRERQQEQAEERREPGGEERQPGEGGGLRDGPRLHLHHADHLAAALDGRGQYEDSVRLARDADLGLAGRPLGPLAVPLDRGAQPLAEVVERLLVPLQPPRRGLGASVGRSSRGRQQDALEFDDPDGAHLWVSRGEALHRLAHGLTPGSRGRRGLPLLGRGDLGSEPHAAFSPGGGGGRLGRLGGRRLLGAAAARAIENGGEGRESDEGPALGPVAPLGLLRPGQERGPEPRPQQRGEGEADQEPAAVRDELSLRGHDVTS